MEYKLYVGNLSYSVTELDLRELFGGLGTVTDAKVVTDRETGRPRGFGFVEMSTEDEARKAIEEVNGRDVQGRQVAVKEAEDRRGGGGGGGGRGGGGGGAGCACGMECTIAQDATSLTLTRTGPAGEIKAVFKLDGSESKNSVAMGQMTMDAVSKATWEGNKLVVTTTADMGGQAMTSKATLSLDATGNLVVEREGGRGPMAPQTYKKS
jgi:RNA recognition motif-containing protein